MDNNNTLNILFLVNAHNAMSQRAWIEMRSLGHSVTVEFAVNEQNMMRVADKHKPDLILCPFLTKRIPTELFRKYKCFIVHPGIRGDRGPSSLDWCITCREEEWGVTIVEADDVMDAGPIWGYATFPMKRRSNPYITKSSVYRHEVIEAACKALKDAVYKFQNNQQPELLNYSNPHIKGILRPSMAQADRVLDWSKGVDELISRIAAADSRPGVKETLLDEQVFLFGAHPEYILNRERKFAPKSIIGKRDGAICIACGEGTAVWITHLKKAGTCFFKLPAVSVLSDKLHSAPEVAHNVPSTWKGEIWSEVKGKICYIHFPFYNGAMSTPQCERLTKEIERVGAMKEVNVVVLMGGYDFFSNGIHLNVIESAADPEKESMNNIQAIDDVVLAIMSLNKLTISTIRGNAAAGGLMMALAADLVWTHENVVLNPHYKSMGLFGSEYWTYNLPRRVGADKSNELTESMLPISGRDALHINLVDQILGRNGEEFEAQLESAIDTIAGSFNLPEKLNEKKRRLADPLFFNQLESFRTNELLIMKENFASEAYNNARRAFVRKQCPKGTPCHINSLSTL